MQKNIKLTLFTVFALSGFCSLLYQVVWIRLAYAHFGIIMPVLSVIISVFMLGLAAGSWSGGRSIELLTKKTGFCSNIFYAFAEGCIGLGAFIVPLLFAADERLLLRLGETNSFLYLLCSGMLIAVSILPFCVLMGMTFPFIMDYIRKMELRSTESFSFLYFANVFGAVCGTVVTTVVFIESYGFTKTLWFAGFLNFIIAGLALSLPGQSTVSAASLQPADAPPAKGPGRNVAAILFLTGFSSLAMEVVWTRAFTPVLGTQVYAFSFLLVVILTATWFGSYIYRLSVVRGWAIASKEKMTALLSFLAFFPIVLNDPRLPLHRSKDETVLLILVSLFPLMTALGYLTPSLIDGDARGNPMRAGKSYAINILGCIIGPLCASYLLLPFAGVTYSLVLLALPFIGLLMVNAKILSRAWRWSAFSLSGILLLVSVLYSSSYEIPWFCKNFVLKRDYTATVVASPRGSPLQYLLVNGQGMTTKVSITKIMAHLPLALHAGSPRAGLIICFGMGTTYRSMLSWDIDTTVVELVPGVRAVFPCFFADAESLLRNPKGHIVIDDGRRFLMRTKESFDVITIDPPPPVEAAGSSLLYSKEFYRLVKRRLNPGGIVQQWFPDSEGAYALDTLSAVTQSLCDSFQYVRCYVGVYGKGVHFIASESPIITPSAHDLAARMPEPALRDLTEWFPAGDAAAIWQLLLSHEIDLSLLKPQNPSFSITDDHPYNEYFLLRKSLLLTGKKSG